jgi:cysteine-rich repeat protein
MIIGRGVGATMALTCALLGLGTTRARAAVRLVDGSCPSSGTGAQLACGPTGPFRTIQEAVNAMAPGDTVSVRGGVYRERIVVSRGCTATSPCVISAYGTERPVLRGMWPRADWIAAGGGVWSRTMEAAPDPPSDQQPDVYHPMTVYQSVGTGPLTPLGYDGDNVSAPRDGHYSYHAGTRRLVVNPIGTAEPSATVHVPHITTLIELEFPAGYLTIRGLTLEGARANLINAVNTGNQLRGIVVDGNQLRYFPRFGIRFNGAPGLVIRNNVIEYGGRGLGGYEGGSYGCYGMRLFQSDGALIQGNAVAHLGHGGCSWCDAPWNDNDHSRLGTNVYANAIDFKQSEGGTIADNAILDVADRGIGLDVARRVTVSRNRVTRANAALVSRTQTPVPGYTACADNVFADNAVDQSRIGVSVEDDGLIAGASFLARIERNAITNTATRYAVPDRSYVIVIEGTSVTTTSTRPPTTTSTSSTTSTSRPPTTSTSTSSSTSTSRPDATTSTAPSTTATSTSSTSTSISSSSTSSSSTSTTSPSPSTTTTTLFPAGCGNAVIEGPEEQCDDGNTEALDGCDGQCLFEEIAVTSFAKEVSTTMDAPGDGLGAMVVSPSVGELVIVETSPTIEPPAELSLVGPQVHVEAPGTTAARPIEITLTVDTEVLDAAEVAPELEVLRNGTVVAPCKIGDGRADPNPCLSARETPEEDQTALVVLSSRGGEYNVAAPDVLRPLTGLRLGMRDRTGDPYARRLTVRSSDGEHLVLGDGGDPTALLADGASLRVVAVGGDGFDATYELPAQHWQLLDAGQPAAGLAYRNAEGAIYNVVFRAGTGIRIAGKGSLLEHTLETEPLLVQVELRFGRYRYCLEFGGHTQKFTMGEKLLRKGAARPAACPAPAS